MRGEHARVACAGSSFGRAAAAAAAAADPGDPMMCHVDNFHESRQAILKLFYALLETTKRHLVTFPNMSHLYLIHNDKKLEKFLVHQHDEEEEDIIDM